MGFLPDLWILAGNQTSLRCSPQVPDYHPPQIGRCSPAAPGHPQGVALLYTTPLYAERGHVYSRATPIGVNLSPCEGQAGHPQGVALLYTTALQATRTPRIIVGPPLAGGLRRSIYDDSTSDTNAAYYSRATPCGWPASVRVAPACGLLWCVWPRRVACTGACGLRRVACGGAGGLPLAGGPGGACGPLRVAWMWPLRVACASMGGLRRLACILAWPAVCACGLLH